MKMSKFKSRKFLISVAAFLGSIGTSVAGLATDNQTVATVGIICSIVSAAIYAGAEAYIDGKAVKLSNNKPAVKKTAKKGGES